MGERQYSGQAGNKPNKTKSTIQKQNIGPGNIYTDAAETQVTGLPELIKLLHGNITAHQTQIDTFIPLCQ